MVHVQTEEGQNQEVRPEQAFNTNVNDDNNNSDNKAEGKSTELPKTGTESPCAILVVLAFAAFAGLGISRFALKKYLSKSDSQSFNAESH